MKKSVTTAWVSLAALALTACGGGSDSAAPTPPNDGAVPAPPPVSTPAPSPAPVPSPSPAPTPAPSPAPTPSPSPAPAPGIDPIAKAAAAPFLGVWKSYPDNYCTDNWPVVPASEMSQRGVQPVDYEFTETTMSYTHNIYADPRSCTQLLGRVTLTGNIQWAPATVNGWTTVARVTTSYAGYTATGGVVVDENEAKAEFDKASKTILGISANSLYLGDQSTIAADGFPTAFRSRKAAYR